MVCDKKGLSRQRGRSVVIVMIAFSGSQASGPMNVCACVTAADAPWRGVGRLHFMRVAYFASKACQQSGKIISRCRVDDLSLVIGLNDI